MTEYRAELGSVSRIEDATAYPLAWPEGRPRTPRADRMVPRFSYSGKSESGTTVTRSLTLAMANERVIRELERMRVNRAVVSTNVELTLRGKPRAGARVPDDPGVAVYFSLAREPIALACDRYGTVPGNLAAHLEATRAIERYGVGSLRELYRGFTALPARSGESWRAVLGPCLTLADVELAYRDRARAAHRDGGGSDDQMVELNLAIAAARLEFGRRA